MDKVKVYRDKAGRWRWHRQSGNGEITADSGQGYEDRSAAYAAAVRENTAAEITVELEES